jgi:hypothetical protein
MSESEYLDLQSRMQGLWMRPGDIEGFAEVVRASTLSSEDLSRLLDAVPGTRNGTTGDACGKIHDLLSRAYHERLAGSSPPAKLDPHESRAELAKEVGLQKDTMIAVATGGPRIDTVNGE